MSSRGNNSGFEAEASFGMQPQSSRPVTPGFGDVPLSKGFGRGRDRRPRAVANPLQFGTNSLLGMSRRNGEQCKDINQRVMRDNTSSEGTDTRYKTIAQKQLVQESKAATFSAPARATIENSVVIPRNFSAASKEREGPQIKSKREHLNTVLQEVDDFIAHVEQALEEVRNYRG